MPVFDPAFAANVKDSSTSLVGIAQVRIAGVTSSRASGTAAVIAAATPLVAVGKSTTITDATDGVTKIVRPATSRTDVNTSALLPVAVAAAGYTGSVDGTFILVTESVTVCAVYAPDGSRTAGTLSTGVITMAAVQGVTISGTITGTAAGDTWVLPVTAATAQSASQTGIVSPYSMFKGSANSVGGLTDSGWVPKIDGISKLESGFPSVVNDQIVTKVSAGVKFTAQEFSGGVVGVLSNLVDAAMTGDLQAIAAEIVFRDKGNRLTTYWCPSCTIVNAPEISAKNDWSTTPWELAVNDQVETGAVNSTHAAWLRNSNLYTRLFYTH